MPRTLLFAALLSSAALAACTNTQDLGGHQDAGGDDGGGGGEGGTSPGFGGASDAGGPSCTGTPTACADIGEQTTCQSRGCTWTAPQCTGTAHDCSSFSQALCPYAPGCAWQSVFGVYQCVGQVTACDERLAAGQPCDAPQVKSGCAPTGGCSGTPTPCEERSMTTCLDDPGCR